MVELPKPPWYRRFGVVVVAANLVVGAVLVAAVVALWPQPAQRPGASNRPTTDPTLPRRCHSTPDARRALVEVGRIVAGSGPQAGAARRAAPPLRWLPERPAAGLVAATGRPPPPPAPPQPPGSQPQRRPWTSPCGPDTVTMRPGVTVAGGRVDAAVPTPRAAGSRWWSAAGAGCTRRSSGRSRPVPRPGCGSGVGRPVRP